MILVYHKVDLESPSVFWVNVNDFYRQMAELKCKKVVYLDNYDPKDPDQVVITFDGVYKDVAQYAAPILEYFNYPFELFVIGDYIGKNNAFDSVEPLTEFADYSDLQKLVKAGGRIQWHTRTHQNLNNITDEKVLNGEFIVPEKIRTLDKKGLKWFGYPHGDVDEKSLNLAKKYFVGALSAVQGDDENRYKLNGITVLNSHSFKKASIGVIIPSYNYGNFLVEAIESVLKQTRPADEILISDDASTDDTYEIAKLYADKFPDLIKVNRNKTKMGIVGHFNKAVNLLKSDYVCILGADNRFRSDYLEKCAGTLDLDDDTAVAYTDFALFGSRAAEMYQKFDEEKKKGILEKYYYLIQFPEFNKTTAELLKRANFIHGSSMYRKKAFDQIGGYKDTKDMPEDHNLFSQIVAKGWKAKRVPEYLLEYRQHSKDQTNTALISYSRLSMYKKEYQKYRTLYLQNEEELRQIKNSIYWRLLFLYKSPKTASKLYGKKIVEKLIKRLSRKS